MKDIEQSKYTPETLENGMGFVCETDEQRLNTYQQLEILGFPIYHGSYNEGKYKDLDNRYCILWNDSVFVAVEEKLLDKQITLDQLADLKYQLGTSSEETEKPTESKQEQPIEVRIQEERKSAKIELLKELIDKFQKNMTLHNLDTFQDDDFHKGFTLCSYENILEMHKRLEKLRE